MNAFIDTMNNTTYTENSAITNKSTLDANLDWFFHGAAMRRADAERIIDLFSKAFHEDPEKALKTLFYVRDCRGGQGERRVFRKCIGAMANTEETQDWLKANLNLIEEYGRFDDYLCLLDTQLDVAVTQYLLNQLLEDKNNADQGSVFISQCAKWMPSLTSSAESKRQAKRFIKLVRENFVTDFTEQKYRKLVSSLRKVIKIVEHNLTNKDYESIDYSKLPSYASLKYRNAFKRNDQVRYLLYLADVAKGKTKINSSTLYPYDLVKKYSGNWFNMDAKTIDPTVEEQWKALPDYVPEINGIVVNDTSGSMTGLPMDVSMSLAVYIAERNKSEVWKNYIIPFSSRAEWKEVKGNTLLEKLKSVYTGDCSNTNLQSVFDLILGRAIEKHIPKEDMPKVLLIITDMEFDDIDYSLKSFYLDIDSDVNTGFVPSRSKKTNFEAITEKYQEAGYERPNLVWWNVDSRNTQTPITKDDDGNILISGCSPAMLSVALSGNFNPIDAMNRIINQPRYDLVTWNK